MSTKQKPPAEQPRRRHDEDLRDQVESLKKSSDTLAGQVLALTNALSLNYAKKTQLDEVGISLERIVSVKVDKKLNDFREEIRQLVIGAFVIQTACLVLLAVIVIFK